MTERSAPAGVRAVVFDLDGTLVDSSPDLAAAVNQLRAELGLSAAPLERVVSWIGEGARRLVEKALADATDEMGKAGALARFLALYESICTERTKPYAGIPEAISGLASRLPLALLTNKPERMTRTIVRHCGWEERFHPLIGGDTLPVRKPDPRGLLAIAERLSVAAAELVLVGDSRIDRDTAAAAGSAFLWAEWGFASAAERGELAASRRASAPRELVPLLLVAAPA